MIEVLIANTCYQETLRWEGDTVSGMVVSSIDEWLEARSIDICKWPVNKPGPMEVFGQTYLGSIRVGWAYGFYDDQGDIAMLFKLTWV